jgi:hypothetical protein
MTATATMHRRVVIRGRGNPTMSRRPLSAGSDPVRGSDPFDGIDDDRIGASDRKHGVEWRAFFPHEQDGGGNSSGQRLNLDSGVFNDNLMQPFGTRAHRAWRRSSVETRALAVLAHQNEESQGHTHEEAVEMAPDTALPITHAARGLLRIIRDEQWRILKGR